MPVEIFEHRDIGIQLIRMSGVLDIGQLRQLHRLHAENPNWLRADVIHVLEGDLDCSDLDESKLDALRRDYHRSFRATDFYLLRRAGWLCVGSAAIGHVERWLRGRHARDGLKSELCLAVEWDRLSPLFDAAELELLQDPRGFNLLAEIDGPRAGAARNPVREADFVSFVLSLADSGQYRDGAEIRRAMSRVAHDLVVRYWADDLQQCLTARCLRAGARTSPAR
ncbi:MAG: hypothetical protein AB7O98_02250 [Hyphomonadaceae bacterium]